MKKRVRMTSRGRITVPPEILGALGVVPGDSLILEMEGNAACVRPAKIESSFEKFRGIGTPGISGGRRGINRWIRKLRGRSSG
jgi:bifunctional DNA-binding transcriptional regulator/antitoxin component of YhaV-PrlF toxin-antitoxin module